MLKLVASHIQTLSHNQFKSRDRYKLKIKIHQYQLEGVKMCDATGFTNMFKFYRQLYKLYILIRTSP